MTEYEVVEKLGARPGRLGVRRSLGADVRAAIPDAVVAVVLTAGVFWIEVVRMQDRVAVGARRMPFMVDNGGYWAFSLSLALGCAAMVWAWGTLLLGLSLPTGMWRGRARRIVERLHRSTSLTMLGLIVLHALVLVWDKMADNLINVFVPYAPTAWSPTQFPYALGIVSLYLAVLFGPSFYLRKRFGPRLWRVSHRYLAVLIYVLGVWHTFDYGTDVKPGSPLFITLWAMQVPLLLGYGARLLAARGGVAPHHLRIGLAVVVIGAAVAAVVFDSAGMSAMDMAGNAWLPDWLRVVACVVFAGLAVIHIGHLPAVGARGRWWHGGHVLMALGMIDMAAPGAMAVPALIGEVVFAFAGLVVAVYVLIGLARGVRIGWLWPVSGVGFAAMAYMFAMPMTAFGPLVGVLVGWFTVSGLGWATGRTSAIAGLAHNLGVRCTLAVMDFAMAYMFLAMYFGMGQLTGGSMAGM